MKHLPLFGIVFSIMALAACNQHSQNTPGVPDSSEISTRESDTSLINNKPDSTKTPGPTIEKDTVQHKTE
ncbi:hypothetical protein MKQ70_32895 [Chitinophaga sedimenti]|uniref:hypothetical protein n=1 Tax=Chitinophaga sedimenti TaxID=2033606 RepID=UPI0020053676|nr:hypothetical protein [Chitinophaga sedimenti]MCK7559509.1 hypothetical protein [Chitinophaga sedimenti]